MMPLVLANVGEPQIVKRIGVAGSEQRAGVERHAGHGGCGEHLQKFAAVH